MIVFLSGTLNPIVMSDHCVLNFTCNLHIDETKSEDKFNFDKGDCAQLSEFSNVNWGSIVDHSAISFHIVFYPEHVFSSILISYVTKMHPYP